jgi:hypothetical protein
MTEEELEKTIRKLVALKNACDMDSAEFAFYERQLRAIRYGPGDEAGAIIEGVDPYWGNYCSPLPAADHPTGKVLRLRPGRDRNLLPVSAPHDLSAACR